MKMYKKAKLKWLRKIARKIWVKFYTKGRRLERLAFPCEHTHTFQHYLPSDTPWFYKGEKEGAHDSLVLEGCYLCGKIKVRDCKA